MIVYTIANACVSVYMCAYMVCAMRICVYIQMCVYVRVVCVVYDVCTRMCIYLICEVLLGGNIAGQPLPVALQLSFQGGITVVNGPAIRQKCLKVYKIHYFICNMYPTYVVGVNMF